MKQYKHKQTGYIAKYFQGSYQIFDANGNQITIIPKLFIENSNDWELIPESKMEIDEGYSHHLKNGSDNFVCESNKCFQDDQALYYNRAILITNPTPLMKQVVKQIEKGECYERYTPFQSMLNKMKNNEDVAIDLWVKQGGCNHHKLLIIPMEANNE